MEKNGKIFVAPPKDGSDFKELFKHLAAVGAGRPVGIDGFPQGPWTPELLAEAITQIDSNRAGVDLRTVQLWFQENDKGISPSNINWLARIFGCDDKEATSEWLLELSAAQSRLTAKRRDSKKAAVTAAPPDIPRPVTVENHTQLADNRAQEGEVVRQKKGFSLANRSEALFGSGSPLNLPASTFAGASALGFLSYIVGIHSVTYSRPDGVVKQVGFLWAPNWTFLFMVLLPLFFLFVIELLLFWKQDARFRLLAQANRFEREASWPRNIEAYSYTYWAVFVICLLFAGVFQWIGVCLIPLLEGGDDYATSWGTIAIVQPDLISVPMEIVFTGLAYLYMCLCFYLFFAGLILLHTIIHDFWRIEEILMPRLGGDRRREGGEIRIKLMRGIFRCTIVGVLVAICMKVQSSYLSSNGEDIATWIFRDLSSVVYRQHQATNSFGYRMPTHYSSLLVAISACVVFLYGSIRLNAGARFREALWKMSAAVGLLFATYLLIDAFDGFSILLIAGVLTATYSLFDPEFALPRSRKSESNQGVS
ncbi:MULTISPECIES: RcgA family putative transporter [unclassified Sinorhizobium]|uniref:RcgA family putative transporter n=1 Tax=unclassified Sinorhizobium TaxID=2613772 RepID=UPI0035252791